MPLIAALARKTVVAGVVAAALGGGALAQVHSAFAAGPATTTSGPATAAHAGAKHHRGHRYHLLLVRLTAKDSGQTVAQVRSQLRAGKSLAEIAGGHASDVERDAIAAIKVRLDAAVKAGKITDAQETKQLARAPQLLDRTLQAHRTPKPTTPTA